MKRYNLKFLHTFNRRNFTAGKLTLYLSLTVGFIILLLAFIFLFFPQTYLNGYIKNRITGSFAKAYPQYSLKIARVNFNILKNRVELDSVSLIKIDSSFSFTMGAFSLSGIDWIKLYRENKFSYNSIAEASIDAEGVVLNLKRSQNQIRCGHFHLSVPDSGIGAESVEFHPLITDEQFFADSKFRNTRYRFVVPKISVKGLLYRKLFNGDNYRAGSIIIRDAVADILVNMDKPFDPQSPHPLMPDAGLSSIKDTIRIGSLQVINARLNYFERYAVGAKAAIIIFDKMHVSAEGIVNHTGLRDTIIIHADGNFMSTSRMKLLMSIPLGSPQFSYSYGGSLQRMEVSDINKFLETSEHRRIVSGTLHEASFAVKVNSGNATGYVHAEYENLSVAVQDKTTGSESGIFDKISSFIAKTFIINGNNMPDKTGALKIGNIKYTHKPDEPFIQFTWFALRSGVGDVVGF